MFTEGIWNCMRELFYPDGQFLALQGGVNALSKRRDSIRSGSNGDCSSGVEPRIVIPVVAGSNPVSHPTHPLKKRLIGWFPAWFEILSLEMLSFFYFMLLYS